MPAFSPLRYQLLIQEIVLKLQSRVSVTISNPIQWCPTRSLLYIILFFFLVWIYPYVIILSLHAYLPFFVFNFWVVCHFALCVAHVEWHKYNPDVKLKLISSPKSKWLQNLFHMATSSIKDYIEGFQNFSNYSKDVWMLLCPPKNELHSWKEKRGFKTVT